MEASCKDISENFLQCLSTQLSPLAVNAVFPTHHFICGGPSQYQHWPPHISIFGAAHSIHTRSRQCTHKVIELCNIIRSSQWLQWFLVLQKNQWSRGGWDFLCKEDSWLCCLDQAPTMSARPWSQFLSSRSRQPQLKSDSVGNTAIVCPVQTNVNGKWLKLWIFELWL